MTAVDWVGKYLVDHEYEPTRDFAEHLDQMSRKMLDEPRGAGRTYDQLWESNFSTVLEWALVDAFPDDFEMLDYRRFSADVRHRETGNAVDLKKHRIYWWEFREHHVGTLTAAIKAGNTQCIMTGSYEKRGRVVQCRFKLGIDARAFEEYSHPSNYKEKRDAGFYYFDHRSAARDGKCVTRKGY